MALRHWSNPGRVILGRWYSAKKNPQTQKLLIRQEQRSHIKAGIPKGTPFRFLGRVSWRWNVAPRPCPVGVYELSWNINTWFNSVWICWNSVPDKFVCFKMRLCNMCNYSTKLALFQWQCIKVCNSKLCSILPKYTNRNLGKVLLL